MQTFNDIISASFVSGGAFDAYDLVGWDDQKIVARDARVKCVAKSPASAAGQDYAGMLGGIARVKAIATIATAGTELVADAGGVRPKGSFVVEGSPVADKNVFAVALGTAAESAFVDIFFFVR